MPLSPKFGVMPPSSGTTAFRSSIQRRLPPLKQQQQQQHQQHQQHQQQLQTNSYHTMQPAPTLLPGGGHPLTNGGTFGVIGVVNNDRNYGSSTTNVGSNGRTGLQYGTNLRVNSVSPYGSANNVGYLSITATSASQTVAAPAETSVVAMSRLVGRRPSPRARHKQKLPPTKPALQVIGSDFSTLPDLSPDLVAQYLRQNPEVLDQYVASNVSAERIDKWLQARPVVPYSRNFNSQSHTPTLNGEHSPEKRVALSKWKTRLQTSKGRVLQELSKEFHHTSGKVMVLLELAACVASAIGSDSYTLYSCDPDKKEMIRLSKNDIGEVVFGSKEQIILGTSVAAAVAYSKEPTRLQDLLEVRQPEVLGVSDSTAESLMALPILDDADVCFGVVEFYRQTKHSQFTEEEEEVATLMLQWYDMLVDYVEIASLLVALGTSALIKAETHSLMIRQRKLSDFLLEVTKSVFQDIVSMDVVIMKIMNFAQRLVNADRASLFLVDYYKHELYARIFDVGHTGGSAKDLYAETRKHHEEISFAKALVHADRTSLFLLDTRSNELYARIFDDGYSLDEFNMLQAQAGGTSKSGSDNEVDLQDATAEGNAKLRELFKKRHSWQQEDIRFSMDKGVAGYVASTGKVLNIKDAYQDPRFNPEVDVRTGYKTKTILCMPIFIRGVVIGVVQMVNKRNGTFTKADEQAFETFAIYCGLALHHAKLYEKIRRSEQKYKVALDVLSYHSQATPEEVNHLKSKTIPKTIRNITRYDFSPWAVMEDEKPMYCLYMFKTLFAEIKFDIEDLMRFTLTVRKNYRNVPYHNWSHAFSVAHSMFTVLQTAKHTLTPVECISLFVSCLCHDLDHRGKTNQFMVQSCSPLAAVYSTSTMEHHHFNQTVTILQNEGHNIFKYLSSDEYKKVLGDIKQSILATDLAVFFKNKVTLNNIITQDKFNWDTIHHRSTLTAVAMTACDLCAMYKPWDVQLNLVYIIMEEFWQQGDEEKKRGITPMQMMDREKKEELPKLEVGFIQSICVPCYELMYSVMPDTRPMLEGAKENLKRWQDLLDNQLKLMGTVV